jgi:hypothetical protein
VDAAVTGVRRGRALVLAALVAALGACAPGAPATTPTPGTAGGAGTPPGRPAELSPWLAADSLDPALVPAGFGTLRQEDVNIRLQYVSLLVRLLPLDESVIRTLSPDAYQTLRELLASRREEIDAIARRYALARPRLWLVSFHGIEQGETRFSPLEVTVRSGGRDFRPVDAVPLTPGFGEQRLGQRETQAALYVFDGALDVNQPMTVTFQTTSSTGWDAILRRVERERSLIRSRAARPPTRSPVRSPALSPTPSLAPTPARSRVR